MLTCLVPLLFTFYIQGVLKLKKNNSGAKGLTCGPVGSVGGMIWTGETEVLGENSLSATPSTKNLTQTHPGAEPRSTGLQAGR